MPVLGVVATSHRPLPSVSYVNHVAKSVVPCCVRFTPHPDSEFAGERHHTLSSGGTFSSVFAIP